MAAQPAERRDYDRDDEPSVTPAGLRIPPQSRQAPIHDNPVSPSVHGRQPAMWLLAAHGRSGAGTLAQIWAPAGDARRGWPARDRHPHVVVVARTDRAGLDAAHDLLLQAAAGLTGGCTLLGLALVPDAPGPLPKTLRRWADVVASAAPAVWRIPYVEDLRTHRQHELAIWTPSEPDPPPPGRMRAPAPSTTTPHHELAVIGREIFAAARIAAGH
ncbi:hypothetical protein O4160_15235 [Rhodococcus sp. IEGM 1401]|uniref:DUF6668 family protein n=1 Tax=Nocardiaceae TaxID=85025 RepID=UPI000B9BA620|nr:MULTISPECIES: DUF6668 family protein [Rhodococcus]MBW4781908.1 hypothetical protein [Rhodococcus fascians]MCZ4562194.1 hypothetical protein [Rhodococcus sp. IEGM 1401]MDI9922237.1 hypothetical protein [Rhodococcus sp. IEGM 1372]MDV8035280.1 DUF6668 family protein [Rhodococcus sp. IEGM 1414]OZD43406.1 hypothetical protein CH266_24930 [Rhodococcus sp. 06-1474-1B]